MSTKNIRPKNPNKQLEKQISIMDSMKFEGPKIVINRTAIHKI